VGNASLVKDHDRSPLAQTAREIVLPGFNAPEAMAAYLNENVPQGALVETVGAGDGFPNRHNYHFLLTLLLNKAVGYILAGQAIAAQEYLSCKTSRLTMCWGCVRALGKLYPDDLLAAHYGLVTRIGRI